MSSACSERAGACGTVSKGMLLPGRIIGGEGQELAGTVSACPLPHTKAQQSQKYSLQQYSLSTAVC